jgi:hypothetical protein
MQIHLYKTGLMQVLLTRLAHGYHWHYRGVIAADRVEAFVGHVQEEFETEATPARRNHRRRYRGEANAFLMVHPDYTEPYFHWWLQLTDGDHHDMVPMTMFRDARGRGDNRLIVPGDYEAVLRPARGGAPRRTWQLTSASFQNYAIRIEQAVRHRTDPRTIHLLLRELHSLPAFRGVRAQIGELRRRTVGEWRRVKPDTARLTLPPFPPYVRFKTFDTIPLAVVRSRLVQGRKPFTWEELSRPIQAPEPHFFTTFGAADECQ